MPIDMKTVKQITNGTKQVVKIEDSNGNVIWGSQSAFPYRRLEYIKFSGNEYLNTGISVPANANYKRWNIKVNFQDVTNWGVNGFDSNTNNRFNIGVTGSGYTRVGVGSANTWQDSDGVAVSLNTTYLLQLYISGSSTCGKVYYNSGSLKGSGKALSPTFSSAPGNLYIGAVWYNGAVASNCKEKVYYSEFYNGSTLTANLIPCQRKSDNVCGLYDVVRNNFYPMQGTSITSEAAGPMVDEYWDLTGSSVPTPVHPTPSQPQPVEQCYAYFQTISGIKKYDFVTKTIETYTLTGSNGGGGSSVCYFNNKLYNGATNARPVSITIDDYNETSTATTDWPYGGDYKFLYGEYCYKTPDGNIYQTITNDTGVANTTYKLDSEGKWMEYGNSSTLRPSGDKVFKYNNNVYAVISNSGNKLVKYVNGSWQYSTDIDTTLREHSGTLPWAGTNCVLYEINDDLYCTIHTEGLTSYDTYKWVGTPQASAGWYDFSFNVGIDGRQIFKIGNRIFGTPERMSTDIYELDTTNMTWSLYWTVPDSVRAESFITDKGGCQLAKACRPKG